MGRADRRTYGREHGALVTASLVLVAVLLGWWVARSGWMVALVLVLVVSGTVAVLGGRYALLALLVWFCALPTQFVPPLRFSLSGLTMDPIKVLVLACVLLVLGGQIAQRSGRLLGGLSVTPLGWQTAGLALVIAAAALAGADRVDGVQWAIHWVTSGLLVAVLAAVWSRQHGAATVIWAVVGMAALLGVAALAEAALRVNPVMEAWLQLIYSRDASFAIARSAAGAIPYKPSVSPYRSLSLIGHPVFAAVAMAPGAAMAAGMASVSRGSTRVVAASACAVASFGIVATGTRGSMLAVVVGVMAVVLLSLRSREVKGGTRAIVTIAVVGALALGLMLSGAVPSVAGVYRLNEDVPQSESFAHRFVTGAAALRVGVRHPLTGVGPGGFRRAYASEVSGSDPISSIEDPARFSVDDMFLLTAADFGLVALALLLLLLATMWRSFGEEAWGDKSVVLRAGLAAVCVSWVFADALYVASAAVPFWILLGTAGLVRRT